MELKNPEYKNWISELKQQIQQSQIKAAIKVNSALIEMYWDLGREISEKHFENTYDSGFFKQLSLDLKKEIPNIKGFSESNLKFCKRFYLFYNQPSENRQQLVNDLKQKLYLIPWGHQIILLSICKDKDEIIAEYSLTDLYKPLGISSYELKKVLPEDFKSLLPSIEEVEEELRKFYL